MEALVTEDLTKRFGTFTAVDGIRIAAEEGEALGLLGPNGAGKTTAIKMLTTLMPPTSGTARICGFDIRRQSKDVRRSIGYVPQMLSADPALSGRENLLMFSKLYDVPRREREERVAQAIEGMGLKEFGDKQVKTYSGGMVRRLEIAQSTLHRPRLLFLDEPTVGLDPVARRAVWSMISELMDDGMTIVLTTHLMDEADHLCDKIAMMSRGAIAAYGSPEELKTAAGASNLDEVFAHYAGATLGENAGSFRDLQRSRRTARRLG